jgi:hypothetical protein
MVNSRSVGPVAHRLGSAGCCFIRHYTRGPGFNLTGDAPEQVHGIDVSEAYFRLFGAPVLLGRTFTPPEDNPDGGHAVVLSYGFWQRKFGGNPKIVGSAISFSNESYTVVGVLDRSFVPDLPADLWVPFQIDPNSTNAGHYFYVSGRPEPGIKANAALKVTTDQYRLAHPEDHMDPRDSFGVEPLRDSIVYTAAQSFRKRNFGNHMFDRLQVRRSIDYFCRRESLALQAAGLLSRTALNNEEAPGLSAFERTG